MRMTIKQLAERYGMDHGVHLVILDTDIEQILSMHGITQENPDYIKEFCRVQEGIVEAFEIFIDGLERVVLCYKKQLTDKEWRKKWPTWGYMGKRLV